MALVKAAMVTQSCWAWKESTSPKLSKLDLQGSPRKTAQMRLNCSLDSKVVPLVKSTSTAPCASVQPTVSLVGGSPDPAREWSLHPIRDLGSILAKDFLISGPEASKVMGIPEVSKFFDFSASLSAAFELSASPSPV